MDFTKGVMNINIKWDSNDLACLAGIIEIITDDNDFNIAGATSTYRISISKFDDTFRVEIFINDFTLELKYEEKWTPKVKEKFLKLLNNSFNVSKD